MTFGGVPAEPEPTDELWPRYAPGEQMGPLIRALAGGLLGGAAALAVDWLISRAAGVPWLWPSVAGLTVTGQPPAAAVGVTLALSICTAAALVFVFGQFRRFVPGPPVVTGAAWGFVLWLVAAPLSLPRWASLHVAAETPEWVLGLAFIAVAQSLLTALVYGTVVGWLNPRRDHRPDED